MAELVTDCPRCSSKNITFDILSGHIFKTQHGWQNWYEAFSVCRNCCRSTIFVLKESVNSDYEHVHNKGLLNVVQSLNNYVDVEGYINLKDIGGSKPPDYLPEDIQLAFNEGATCLSVGCFNASGAMFRLCVDLATKSLLPEDDVDGLNNKIRRSLGLRLKWLLEHKYLPNALEDLSLCIKDDGNDGVHFGNLIKEDAVDLLDFTYILLDRMYSEPERIKLAKERKISRRTNT